MKRSTIVEVVAILLVILFAYTAASKLLDIGLFKLLSRFLPYINKFPVAIWIFPIVELVIIFLLLLKNFRKWGFYSVATVMLIVIVYRIVVLTSGKHLPCLCGPVVRKLNEHEHIYFNIIVLLVSVGAILLSRQKSNVIEHPVIDEKELYLSARI